MSTSAVMFPYQPGRDHIQHIKCVTNKRHTQYVTYTQLKLHSQFKFNSIHLLDCCYFIQLFIFHLCWCVYMYNCNIHISLCYMYSDEYITFIYITIIIIILIILNKIDKNCIWKNEGKKRKEKNEFFSR